MNLNPEFRRNLWLELTPSRLAGMPLVLGALLFLAYLLDGKQYGETVARTALLLYGLLAILWGTRLASEALISEIRDHTWDSQRMSVIGPWSMTWGKLLGSTIYPWYGALFCLLVYLTSVPSTELSLPATAVLMIGCGLFGQALGLLASLQAIRKHQRYGRFQTTAFLVLGAGCAVSVLNWPFAAAAEISWYGQEYPDEHFVLASLLLFLGWTVFGIFRLIRAELQLRSLPWGWWLFTLFLTVYLAGFPGFIRWQGGEGLWQQRLLVGFLVPLGLAYATAFGERKDPVAFRRLLQALGQRAWRQLLADAPLWLCTLPLAVFSCVLLIAADGGAGLLAVPAAAMLIFLARDCSLLLFFNLGRVPKRADMLALLWLVLLYGVIPTILAALDFEPLTGLFWPAPGQPAALVLCSALVQAAIALWLLVWRWRARG